MSLRGQLVVPLLHVNRCFNGKLKQVTAASLSLFTNSPMVSISGVPRNFFSGRRSLRLEFFLGGGGGSTNLDEGREDGDLVAVASESGVPLKLQMS
jgi:hypothetical protein